VATLPHWARVAFAAHCARQAFPIFRRYWPNATAERVNAVKRAILLAEDSAAKARPAEGLKDAIINALVAAGAGLGALYGLPEDMRGKEPLPADGNAGTLASFAVKSAEKAATAANSPNADS